MKTDTEQIVNTVIIALENFGNKTTSLEAIERTYNKGCITAYEALIMNIIHELNKDFHGRWNDGAVEKIVKTVQPWTECAEREQREQELNKV